MSGGIDILDILSPLRPWVFAGERLGGFRGAARRNLWRSLISERLSDVSLLASQRRAEELILQTLALRIASQWESFERELARQKDNMIFATLLAEV